MISSDISSDIPSLERHLAEIRQRRQEISRELRRVQQRRRRDISRDRLHRCSPGLLDTAVTIYIITMYDINLATAFLQTRLDVNDVPDVADLTILIEDAFLTWSVEDIVDFLKSDAERLLQRRALNFKAEADTVTWIRLQNYQQGTAPVSGDVFQHYSELLGNAPLLGRWEPVPANLGRRIRKFSVRLRQRWCLGLRTMPQRDTSPHEERLQKVRLSRFRGDDLWLEFGTFLVTTLGAHFVSFSY